MVLPLLAGLLPMLAPMLGPLLGGLFGGGGAPAGGAPAGGAAGGLPLDQIVGMLGRVAPGLGAAGAAAGPAAGPAFDPRILEPIVREAVAATLRSTGLNVAGLDPQAIGGLAQVGRDATSRNVQQHTNEAGRATVAAVRAELAPELAAIKRRAEHRASQIDATAEHRDRVARDDFRRAVITRLNRIENNRPQPRRF